MEEPRLPAPLNPSTFPAKLWRLVNSPSCRSIAWDARGEGLLVDQALLERELLGAGPGHAAGPGGDGAELFQTRNFSSFVRQLNLYGFRKVVAGPAGSAARGPQGGTGDGGSSAGPLHHFQSPHFRRQRPDLLLNMKRLTRGNRAKLAAGLEVTSRPANRFQRLLGTALHGDPLLPPWVLSKARGAGLLAVGQAHPNHFLPYSCVSTSSQNQSAVHATTSQGSCSLLPGHQPPAASAGNGVFPVLRSCATPGTYTVVQSVPSFLTLERWPQGITTSPPSGLSCAPPGQGWPACSPPAAAPCGSPAACTDPLTGCAGPAVLPSTQSSFVQSPPAQSPCAGEFPPSDWRCHTPDESKETEVDLATVFQLAEEMCSPLLDELVKVESVPSEDLCAAHAVVSAERAAAELLENSSLLCAAVTEESPEPVNTSVEENFHLQGDVACKQRCFWEEGRE
ncbi:heat shock factor protein 5-like [Apus apus]|uniref:heat shock factor protein 5-like n=1 Tax=Apus apus TaxID=8895 RepID=UPI0021F87F69|nr:heat shock factor protein 5-like [Apus apus]